MRQGGGDDVGRREAEESEEQVKGVVYTFCTLYTITLTHLVPFRLGFEELHCGCAGHLTYEGGHRGVCLRVPIGDLNQTFRLPCELLPFG